MLAGAAHLSFQREACTAREIFMNVDALADFATYTWFGNSALNLENACRSFPDSDAVSFRSLNASGLAPTSGILCAFKDAIITL